MQLHADRQSDKIHNLMQLHIKHFGSPFIKIKRLYAVGVTHDTRITGKRQAAGGPSLDNGERKAPPGELVSSLDS